MSVLLGIRRCDRRTSKDSEKTLSFCALTSIRPMIEQFPREDATRAYQRMITGQVRFRAVLVNRA